MPTTQRHAPAASDLHAALLDWYARHRRDLPWRRTRDPYAILLSEVMLQQTQVHRVIPKYHEFLARFPTFCALASTPLAEVIRRWAPLGYNRRAVRLHRIARAVVERYDGALPSDPQTLLALEGIGPYTAAAVACFAFGHDVPVLDTNVRRVLSRVLYGPEPPPPADLRQTAQAILPAGRAPDWNQALMDLGATAASPASPTAPSAPSSASAAPPPSGQAGPASPSHAPPTPPTSLPSEAPLATTEAASWPTSAPWRRASPCPSTPSAAPSDPTSSLITYPGSGTSWRA